MMCHGITVRHYLRSRNAYHSAWYSIPLMLLVMMLLLPATATAEEDVDKSPGGAFLRSLIFPGWGENYMERPTSGYWFRGIEYALLAGITGYSVYSSWRAEEYRSLAEDHAGINSNGRTHSYYVNIGIYDNVDDYNQAMRRDNNYDACLYDSADAWQWDSRTNRHRFRQVRLVADDAKAKAVILGGGVFLNHVFSAIHALKLGGTDRFSVSIYPANTRQLVTLTLQLP
ncbi:MAG: hypothetical protein ISR91_03085 [Candidatus Delongbacteria bacterium]|nr:hypothetical protein [bacterium]MBL7033106.1 hypothetical protein [Candidatus Delongbacteria bacterium]